MMTNTSIAILLAIAFATANAVPYSKYGRSCKDIGCRSNEVCVMAEDPCTLYQRDSCGRYPTCQRSGGGGESCTTKICPSGQYCKTENGMPTCVNTTPGFAPSARRPPGYERPRVTPRPVIPTPPTHPTHSSSFDYRNGGSGDGGLRYSNNIGKGSIWDQFFGGGGSNLRTRPSGINIGQHNYDRPTSRPTPSTYNSGGKGYYNSHTTTDSKGNKVWTFSG